MPKVLISDKLSPRAAEIFQERGVQVDTDTGLSPEALIAKIGQYDGLAVRSATKVTQDVLAAAKNLKVIGRAGIGVDNIDVKSATEHGVVVMNTPFGNSITTAEHAIAMMFALARQIPAADRSTQAGKWEKSRFMGVELFGKTLGLIGCGNIGSIVADRAQGLKMKVVAFDPYLSEERATDIGITKVDLEELLSRSDFITLHTPLTDVTRGLIDAKALAKCRKGVRIINCARGGLVVEEDLKAAMESGQVAGAALDVFTVEPAKENALFGSEGLVATPHLGASTVEAQENVALQVAEQMADFLVTGAVVNALNMPSVSAEEAPRLKPYMRLAELLGRFIGQATETSLKGISIEFEGHAASLNPKPITAAAITGVLTPLMDSVNMVNALAIARERDIEIKEVRHERDCDYQTLVRVMVTTERRTRSVAGTLIGGTMPRIVSVEDIAIEAELSPHMLFVRNQDKPGLIGGLGSVLGNAGVNIATFHLGRRNAGADAIALLQIDQPLPDSLLSEILELPQVDRAIPLKFPGTL